MSTMVRLDLTLPSNEATFIAKTFPINTDGHRSFVNLSTYLAAIAGAVYSGKCHEVTGATQAQATIAVSFTGPTNTETMTIANGQIEAVSGTPSGDQIKTNSSATVVANEIAALINSSATWAGLVTATAATGVVTVTAVAPGAMGNGLEVDAGTFANTVVVGFANGADGHTFDFNVGQA